MLNVEELTKEGRKERGKKEESPAPPFYHTSLDLFGPFIVKDPVKKRTTMKVFRVIFTCVLSRGVYLDIAEGYDTNSFLRVFRRFTSLKGFPKIVFSDHDSQLVKSNKEFSEMVDDVRRLSCCDKLW